MTYLTSTDVVPVLTALAVGAIEVVAGHANVLLLRIPDDLHCRALRASAGDVIVD